MIRVFDKGNRLNIKFIGKKNQFSEYINKIMKIDEKDYDHKERCWCIPKKVLPYLEYLFPNLELLEEVESKRLEITDYDEIGKNLKLPPFNYQKEAIKLTIDKNNILIVYPCGAGKTVCGIGAYVEAKERKIINGPGMIVVKASLKYQWLKEVKKFSNLKAVIIKTPAELLLSINGKIKRKRKKLKKYKIFSKEFRELKLEIAELEKERKKTFEKQFKNYDLYILNYETLNNEEIRKRLHKKKIEFIFADEIQQIKSPNSKRNKSLCEFNTTKMKVGATATPIQKDPQDVFGIFSFINPTIFPKAKDFERKYMDFNGYGVKFKNEDHMQRKIAPYTIFKTKEDISDQLPKLYVTQRYCDLEDEQQEISDAIKFELDELNEKAYEIKKHCKNKKEMENNEDLLAITAKTFELQAYAQEIADCPEILLMSDSKNSKKYGYKALGAKFKLCMELLEEYLESGEKVCIMSKYVRMQEIFIREINKRFKNIKIAHVSGNMKDKEKTRQIYDLFSDDEEYRILLGSDTIAEGVNLSKCKYLIEYELAVSYSKQKQRHGRLERADSIHDTVFVTQLICNKSWDETQQKIVSKKEGFHTRIFDSMK